MIHHATGDFDFKSIHLSTPTPLQGGSLYTKILMSPTDEPLFIYTPRCTSKNGVVTSGSKRYVDLVFTRDNQNMLDWASTLEDTLSTMLFQRRSEWFTEDLELDDIQGVFMPMIKSYKTQHVGRFYLNQGRQKINPVSVQVYSEDESPCDITDIKEGTDLIAILEVQGIRFSTKSFQLSISVKQIMVFNVASPFSQCLIRQQPDIVEVDIPEPNDTISIRPYILDRIQRKRTGTRSVELKNE